jgi:hypothetical protein
MKPMRRWLPQTPTRMQNKMYAINASTGTIALYIPVRGMEPPTIGNASPTAEAQPAADEPSPTCWAGFAVRPIARRTAPCEP